MTATALSWDLCTVAVCLLLYTVLGRPRPLHPFGLAFLFHLYAITARLAIIQISDQTSGLFNGVVSFGEIGRAAACADLSLLTMCLVYIVTARHNNINNSLRHSDEAPGLISSKTVRLVVPALLIIGAGGLILFSRTGPYANGIIAGVFSSYLYITITWALQGTLILVYYFGFKRWVAILALPLLAITSFETLRFAFVVAVLFMFACYLSRTRRRSLPVWTYALLLILFAVWFPMKTVARGLVHGDAASAIWTDTRAYIEESLYQRAGGGDTQFLDMAAAAMTLTDLHGEYAYGRTWLPLLVSPIPRQIWSEKPRMNEYLWQISDPERPMAIRGMVPMLVGDAYMNGGYIGVVVVSWVVALIYWHLYSASARRPHLSRIRFLYLIVLCTSVLVYRDGIMSLFVFTLINSMPMMLFITVSAMVDRRRSAYRYSTDRSEANRALFPVGHLRRSGWQRLT